jgi:hypothetical protein
MKIQREGTPRFVLVSDFYEPLARPLQQGVRSFYEGLKKSQLIAELEKEYGQILAEDPPLVAFRAGRSLGSYLGPIFKKGSVALAVGAPKRA